jgi:hypothetical protein
MAEFIIAVDVADVIVDRLAGDPQQLTHLRLRHPDIAASETHLNASLPVCARVDDNFVCLFALVRHEIGSF